MLKKVITAKLNSENLIETQQSPADLEILKKAALLEKAKAEVEAKEETNDEQVQSSSAN